MRKLGLLALMICGAFLAFSLAHLMQIDGKSENPKIRRPQVKATLEIPEESLLSQAATLAAPLDVSLTKNATVYQDEMPERNNGYNEALQAFKEGRYNDVYKLANRALPQIEGHSDESEKWLHLLIENAYMLGDGTQLALLFEFEKKPFLQNEPAALLLAKNTIQLGNYGSFQEILNLFEKTAPSDEWRLLESDALLLQNRRVDAVALLENHHFTGDAELERLLRLALFHIRENPKQAWTFLQQASLIDPNNSEILSYQGKLMELVNQKDKALAYYFTAWNLNPENPKLRDQLADFYLRNQQYARALGIWKENLDESADEETWVKTLFFSRVIKPVAFAEKTSNGDDSEYSDYLYSLKPWEFWNETKLSRFDLKNVEKTEQSAFWLKLLHQLSQKNDKAALEMVKNNPFKRQSWSPLLELGLDKILTYRETGFFSLDDQKNLTIQEKRALEDIQEGKTHPFFKEILLAANTKTQLAGPTKDFYQGDLVLPALFLASGWNEAALELLSHTFNTNEMPIWLAMGLLKAMQENHGLRQAIVFSKQLPDTAEIRLLKAEFLIDARNPKEALSVLEGLNDKVGEEGKKAAFLEAAAYLELEKNSLAELVIRDNPLLESSQEGKELLARIALSKGDEDLAEELYHGIISDSFEAKSFLARKAYERGDLEKSKQWTLELLEQNPSNATLRENLQSINWHLSPDRKNLFP